MYYPDLSCYRDGDLSGMANLYPEIKNIGWLGNESSFTTGYVAPYLIDKLEEILFLDIKNQKDQEQGTYDASQAVCIHQMHMRGSPYQCPLCDKGIIEISSDDLEMFAKPETTILGRNEVCIPARNKGEFYAFPTLIYHYITEHEYCPPQEFLDAVDDFNLHLPYDVDEAQEDVDCIELPMSEANNYRPK